MGGAVSVIVVVGTTDTGGTTTPPIDKPPFEFISVTGSLGTVTIDCTGTETVLMGIDIPISADVTGTVDVSIGPLCTEAIGLLRSNGLFVFKGTDSKRGP